MGRKNTSVKIDRDRIEKLRIEKGYKKATIARKIGYSLEAVTNSINNGIMDVTMLEKIAELFDRTPAFLQGKTDFEWGYNEYVTDKTWDERTHFFRQWVKQYEKEIRVQTHDLPVDLQSKNNPPDYCLKDFIDEYYVTFDDDGNRLEDAYDVLAGEVLEFLRQELIKIYIDGLTKPVLDIDIEDL